MAAVSADISCALCGYARMGNDLNLSVLKCTHKICQVCLPKIEKETLYCNQCARPMQIAAAPAKGVQCERAEEKIGAVYGKFAGLNDQNRIDLSFPEPEGDINKLEIVSLSTEDCQKILRNQPIGSFIVSRTNSLVPINNSATIKCMFVNQKKQVDTALIVADPAGFVKVYHSNKCMISLKSSFLENQCRLSHYEMTTAQVALKYLKDSLFKGEFLECYECIRKI
jgi:hypothetical protein